MTASTDTGVPVPPTHLVCTDECVIGTAVLRDGLRGRPRVPAAASARSVTPRSAPRCTRTWPTCWRGCTASTSRRRPRRLRQARQLLRAPDRPMEPAVRRGQDRRDSRDGSADGVAARAHSARRRDRASCTATIASRISSSIPPSRAIVAIVDWELSTLGHPLADLAYNCLTYHLRAGSARPRRSRRHRSRRHAGRSRRTSRPIAGAPAATDAELELLPGVLDVQAREHPAGRLRARPAG